MAQKQYEVIGALALVRQGDNLVYLYKGAPVPADANKEQIERLLAFGLIGEVKKPKDSEDSKEPQVAYADMEYAALQALAKERGIAANLSQKDLIAALSG